MNNRPNILLITTDTQRCDTLNCMGYPHAISPNLDRLADEGVMFTQAHTSAPVCMPARSCLLTGLHTPIHGAIENGTTRLDHVPTFPDVLKQEGYRNIMVGKTHFGAIPDSFDALIEEEYTAYLEEIGYDANDLKTHPTPIPEEHFRETWLVDQTIGQIDQASSEDAPFFAFCSMPAPHPPETPPGKWMDLYRDSPLPELNLTIGDQSYELNPGDSFRIRGEAYRWSNPHSEPAVAIWVISPPVY